MSKRKQNANENVNQDSSEEDATSTLIDVDFDFFDLNPGADYHGINRLLVQLLGPDAENMWTGGLADLILSAAADSGVGSTIKTDGEEGDPCAFLTVLSCDAHKDSPAMRTLIDYILLKTKPDPSFYDTVSSLLATDVQSQNQTQTHVGIVVGERLINMPVQVIPPMYRMLVDEMKQAITSGKPYEFTHYIFLSRAYHLTARGEEMVPSPRNTKRYKAGGSSESERNKDGVYGFHLEDEEIIKVASHVLTYSYANAAPHDAESVGLDVLGRAMLVPADRLEVLVHAMTQSFSMPGLC